MYDIVILGGGVAGLSAAIYSARFNLNIVVLSKRLGGLIQDTHIIENYPGFKSITGQDLSKNFIEHAKNYDIKIKDETAKSAKKIDKGFLIKTDKSEYKSKTLIFATGTTRRKLGVEGEKKFQNKGVAYCALCDAPLFKGKTVCVIGGSDSAAKEALLLSEYCEKVYIIYRRDKIRAEPINYDRIMKNKKIELIYNTNITQIFGEIFVKGVKLDKPYKGSSELKLDGVFIEIGAEPNSKLASDLGVKLNKNGEIIINKDCKTNVLGVFAGGDITDRKFKQAIVGVGDAVTASFSAQEYINSLDPTK